MHIEEGEAQQGQEALETALALVTDRQLRLTLLGDYTALLASQSQWAKVLRQAKEALRLVPNDPGWLATQAQAQSQLEKTKEQWFNEGNTLENLKRYDEALAAYEQAIRLDPNYASAYHNKGVALDNLGKSREAKQAYDKARQLGYTG